MGKTSEWEKINAGVSATGLNSRTAVFPNLHK